MVGEVQQSTGCANCIAAFVDGMRAGIAAGRGMRKGFEEVAAERAAILYKAGKILEAGYIGQDPNSLDFAAAFEAYQVIANYFEGE